MDFSFLGGESDKYFLVFDIGNRSVSGAIVKRTPSRGDFSLNVVKNVRKEIALGEHAGFDALFKNMSRALEEVARALYKGLPAKNLRAYVILASPWYTSQTKIITVRKKEPFVLDKKTESGIIERELSVFKDRVSGEGGMNGGKLAMMESNIIHAVLNGYDTTSYSGKKASEFKLALYLSVTQSKVKENILEKLGGFFPKSAIALHSFPLAYYNAVRDAFPEKNDFLMMDVSGEITDISLVRKGVLVETFSFPLGRNFLIRRMASKTGATFHEAESMHAILSENMAGAAEKKRLGEIIASAKQEWLEEFEKALSDLSGELYVPGEIFLAADDEVAELFASFISESGFSQYSAAHEKFRVTRLSAIPGISLEKPDTAEHDRFTDIGALFAEKLIEAAR